MRNLKRALSLTLASVMLLGMMVVGASAAGFPDVDQEDNVEAIEVLQAVKVMVGNADNGNFEPDRSVTRSEMAVVMANLLDLDYQYYEASCPFWDVPTWARPYVGACYANGIVSGYNATTYGASDDLTPVQAASMMMRALGYFQYASDYADGFETATVRQGTRIGIFNDVGSSATAAMTRNQVAQMALNALECTMVDAKKSTADITVGSGDTAVSISGQVEYIVRTSRENFAYAINDTESSGNSVSGVQGATVELGEQLYNGDLKKQSFENGDEIYDVFGSPATRWVYKTTEIGTYAEDATVTYTAEVESKDLYKDLGMSVEVHTGSNGGLVIWEDGIFYAGEFNTIARSGDEGDQKLGGNGTLVKAYKYENNNSLLVVLSVINTYLAQVDGAYNADDDSLELDMLSPSDGELTVPAVETTLEDEDFAGLSSYSDGDYVLVNVGSVDGEDQEIMTIAPAEVMTGEVDKYTKGASVTVAGDPYKYSKTFANNVDATVLDDIEYEVGKDSKFVLDSYGYIIGLDEVNGANSYVYIDEFASEGKYTRNEKFYADAYFTDGTVEDITLNKVDNKDITDVDEDGAYVTTSEGNQNTGWYRYTTNNKGEYNLTSVDNVGGDAITSASTKVVENGETKVIYATDGSYLRGNNATAFIIRDGKDVYASTGIKEVGTVTTAAADGTTKVMAVANGSYATYVFVDVGNGELKGTSKASGDSIFILDAEGYRVQKDKDGEYYTYDAILNGKKIGKDADNAVKANDASIFAENGLYVEVYYDENGQVDEADLVTTPLTDDDYGVKKNLDAVTITQKGQTLIFGAPADSVYLNGFIRLIDGTDVSSPSANSLARMFNGDDAEHEFTGNVWATFEDGDATGLYVQVLDEIEEAPIPVNKSDELEQALEDAGVEMEVASETEEGAALAINLSGMTPGEIAKIGYTTTSLVRAGTEYVYSTKADAEGNATAAIQVADGVSEVNIVSFASAEAKAVNVDAVSAVAIGDTGKTVAITADPAEAIEGQTVTLTAALTEAVAAGKKVTITFTAPAEKTIEIEAGVDGGDVTFVMGAEAVNVAATAAIEDVDGEAETYAVDVSGVSAVAVGDTGKTVAITADPAEAAEGDTVTLTATLTEAVDSDITINFTAPAGKTIEIAAGETEGTVEFEMPGEDVTVAATVSVEAGAEATAATYVVSNPAQASTEDGEEDLVTVTIGGKAYDVAKDGNDDVPTQAAAWADAYNADTDTNGGSWEATADENGQITVEYQTDDSQLSGQTGSGLTGGTFTDGDQNGTNAKIVFSAEGSASETYTSSKYAVTIGGKAYDVDKSNAELADQIDAWIEAFNAENSATASAAKGTEDNDGNVVFTAATEGSSVTESVFTNLGLSGGTFTAGTDAEGA